MGLRINTNVQSLVSQHRLSTNRVNLEHTQTRVASGSRIVRASDDAAGIAISEQINATLRGTVQNIKNAQSGFQMMQTADGALEEVSNILIRMKELAVQASSDTYGDRERSFLNDEYQELKSEMERMAHAVEYNGRPLMNGEGDIVQIQVGPENQDYKDRIAMRTDFDIRPSALGVEDFNVLTTEAARSTLEPLNDSLGVVAKLRGAIGASEARLESTMKSLGVFQENLTGAFSEIRDADIAHETAQLARFQIMTQAGVSILAQANNNQALALKLLS
jgi:flagellin